jgi:VanZ family protein
MLALQYARYWKAIGALLIVVTLVSAMLPVTDEGPAHWLLSNDKILHGAVFFLLTLWFCGQFERREYWLVGAGLLAFGAMIEIFQLLTAYRKGEFLDLVADAAGIGAGIAAAVALGLGGWSLRIERMLAK